MIHEGGVELRLTVMQEPHGAVIYVDGRLAAENLKDFEQVLADARGGLIIDLSNLVSADDAGVATLKVIASRGAQLVGASPYVALLLDDERPRVRQPPKARRRRGRRR